MLIVIVIGVIAYIISFFYQAIKKDPNDPVTIVNFSPANYIGLFNQTVQKKLLLKETMAFNLRDTISIFNYDEKYDLEITKINTKSPFHFENDIIEAYTKPTGKITYCVFFDEPEFITNYKDPSTESASKIYLSLCGDSAKTVLKNDSISSYYLKLKNIYIQYEHNSAYEIYIKPKMEWNASAEKKSVDLMFFKKNNVVYFLLFASNSNNVSLNPDLLHKLVSKE